MATQTGCWQTPFLSCVKPRDPGRSQMARSRCAGASGMLLPCGNRKWPLYLSPPGTLALHSCLSYISRSKSSHQDGKRQA